MKSKILKICMFVLIYIVLITIFLVTLFATSCFPNENIKDKVEASSKTLSHEGNVNMQYILHRGQRIMFDNFTDALMINNAYSIDNENPLESAMLVRKNYIKGVTKEVHTDTTGELESPKKYDGYDPVSELQDTVNNNIEESYEYARYWHGYLIVLRPLLLFFDISQIRIILTVILIILAIVLLFLIAKKIGIRTMICFLISLIFVEYFYMGQSLQGVSIFIIMMVSSIIILLKDAKIKNFGIFFFVIGIVTNFFDFLTVPILTIFVPLIIYFLLTQRDEKMELKKSVCVFLKYTLLWGIGYILTWISKWVIVDILYNRNLIYTSIMQMMYRSGEKNKTIESIQNNLKYEIDIIKIYAIFVLTGAIVNKLKYGKNARIISKESIPYLVIGLVPFAWYIFIANHSILHHFFTYRNLFLTLICMPFIVRVRKIE